MHDTKKHVMSELSGKLDVCLTALQGKFVFLDYPVNENVGDLLIWHGTQRFFKRHGIKPLGQFSVKNTGRRAHRLIEACDTICFHGGGNFGDLWPQHHRFREDIVQRYPHKRIVILPQSVHFDDAGEMERSCAIFRAHKNMHIFVRDRHSLASLQNMGLANVRLCPDMAHALWGHLRAPAPSRASPLFFLRRDKEQAFLPSSITARHNQAIDWADLLEGFTGRAFRWGSRVVWTDGGRKLNNRLPAFHVWNAVAHMMIGRAVALFAPYETIVTNRLHAVILSALLGRNVTAYDNSYGKISSYVDCWMASLPGVDLQKS